MRNLTFDWFAGLFEGEGCISIGKPRAHRNEKYICITLRLCSTDEDVMRAIPSIAGYGKIRGPITYNSKTNKKPVWEWTISNKVAVYSILTRLYPYLSKRRASKADEAFLILRQDKRIIQLEQEALPK